jgi:prepilin-type N-terminal cleavage/methylation domain-containing protein
MPSQDRQRGFTLLELMIVIVIILVVAAMAIPSIMQAMYNLRLRSSGSEVAGVLQGARMRAIRDNQTYPVSCTPQPLNNCTILFIDTQNPPFGSGVYVPADGVAAQLPGTVRFSTAAPPISPVTLGFVPLVNQQPYFNSRGLPCSLGGGGVCTPNGFIFYFQDQRPLGANGFSAVAVTPAGRIRVYSYSIGSGWFQS